MRYMLLLYGDPCHADRAGELSSMTTMHSSSAGFEVVDATAVHADDIATTVQQSVDGQRVIDAPHRSGTDDLIGTITIVARDLDVALEAAAGWVGDLARAIDVRPVRHG